MLRGRARARARGGLGAELLSLRAAGRRWSDGDGAAKSESREASLCRAQRRHRRGWRSRRPLRARCRFKAGVRQQPALRRAASDCAPFMPAAPLQCCLRRSAPGPASAPPPPPCVVCLAEPLASTTRPLITNAFSCSRQPSLGLETACSRAPDAPNHPGCSSTADVTDGLTVERQPQATGLLLRPCRTSPLSARSGDGGPDRY